MVWKLVSDMLPIHILYVQLNIFNKQVEGRIPCCKPQITYLWFVASCTLTIKCGTARKLDGTYAAGSAKWFPVHAIHLQFSCDCVLFYGEQNSVACF